MRSPDDDFGIPLFVVRKDNYDFDETGEGNVVTFTKKGIYTYPPDMLGYYLTVLHIDGFSFGGGGAPKKPTSYPPGGVDTVTWNGNIAGKEYVDAFFVAYVKVSDAIPTLADVEKGGVIKTTNGESTGEVAFSSSNVMEGENGVITIYGSMGAIIIPYDGWSNTNGVQFPSAGVYFCITEEGYVSSLTINDYLGFEGGSEWSEVEPKLAEGESLYSTICNVYNDGTFTYSDVSKSHANNSVDIQKIMLAMNPVGTIVMNITGTNPSEYIGGTWVAWGQGRTPVGLGMVEANTTTSFGDVAAGELDWITVEAKGGEYKHTLTTDEMPSHGHKGSHGSNTTGTAWVGAKGTSEIGHSYTENTGGGESHNNIMPYITCYFWKRTA